MALSLMKMRYSYKYMLKLKKGDILIADPSNINDDQFNRSIILLTSCSVENEIVGFILNKLLNYKLNDLFPEISEDFNIYDGGPVSKDNLYFLHDQNKLIPKSLKISDELFWSGDFEKAKELINNGELTSDNIKFCLGYSGWSVKQLLNEIKEGHWVKSNDNISKSSIFSLMKNTWKNKMIELGGEYKLWSNSPKDPSFN